MKNKIEGFYLKVFGPGQFEINKDNYRKVYSIKKVFI